MKKGTRVLAGAERVEALLVTEELLCQRYSPAKTKQSLMDQYRLSDGQAADLVAEVLRQFRETAKAHAPERRAQHLRVLDRLFNRAWAEGKLGVCVEIERLLARVEGHEQPQRHVFEPGDKTAPADEFAGRSEADLLYYTSHGHFPEDAPAGAPAGDSPRDFPLH